PEDPGDAVADREHGPRLGDVDLAVIFADLALQDVGDLARLDVHRSVSSHETGAQLLELRSQRSVEDEPTHRGDGATEKRSVHRDLEVELPAGARGEGAAQALALLVGERARR